MIDFYNNITAHHADLVLLGTSLVTAASAAANIFPKAKLLGKIVHFLALNFKSQ